MVEEAAYEGVGQTIHEEFDGRVVDGATAFHEAAAEDAVVAFVELLPVADDVAAVVRFVGHHNYGGVTFHRLKTAGDRTSKAVLFFVLYRSQFRKLIFLLLKYLPSAVGGAVVDDDDFVRDAAEVQLEVQMLDSGCDAAFLVAGWDDDRQESEWRGWRRRQVVVSSVQFAVGMLNFG